MNDFSLIKALDQPGAGDAAMQTAALEKRRDRMKPFAQRQQEYARDYVATDALRTAVDVALSLGRPLLLTGEPGSGKTLAARWIADRFGLAEGYFEEFQVRSDSRARDLRYEFDAVGWFRQSNIGSEPVDKTAFLQPRALGKAFGWDGQPVKPYVVLIDEIDKAPRDFPNDLLLELDQMRFVIEETQRTVGPPENRPMIVITSNSERRLPDPFLRRCVTHQIELTPETVFKVLERRLAEFGATADLLRHAAAFWKSLDDRSLTRKPTIAEFWQWLALETRFGTDPAMLRAAFTGSPDSLNDLQFVHTLFLPRDLASLIGKR